MLWFTLTVKTGSAGLPNLIRSHHSSSSGLGKVSRVVTAAIVGALLAFAPAASAANYDLVISNARTYAEESITSVDVVIGYQGNAPTATVWLYLDDAELTAIGRNDTIDLTFTLSNAKFARKVSASALRPEFNAAVGGCDVRVRSADGEAGSSRATFSVEATEGDCTGTGGNVNFAFTLPALTGLTSGTAFGGGRRNTGLVFVRVTTDTPGGSGWPGLDARGRGVSDLCGQANDDPNEVCSAIVNDVLSARWEGSWGPPFEDRFDGIDLVSREPHPEVSAIRFTAGFWFDAYRNYSPSLIDLAAGRTGFVASPAVVSVSSPVTRKGGQAYLGVVNVGLRGASACISREPPYAALCALQADGRPFSLGRRGHGRGHLHVTVTGDFRDGDTVFLDLDRNDEPSTDETLELQNNGSMQRSFRLDHVAGNNEALEGFILPFAATAGEAGELEREEGWDTQWLIYRPNGRDSMRPAQFRSTYSVTTSSASVADLPAIATRHSTNYTLVEGGHRYAYAIPPMRAGDTGMVRVKCEVATQCVVYLQCDSQDGEPYFAQVPDPVPGRTTLVLTAESLGEALGLTEGAWETGRMTCSVYATRDISVQQLTRSSTGVLVNNTYVDDDH